VSIKSFPDYKHLLQKKLRGIQMVTAFNESPPENTLTYIKIYVIQGEHKVFP